MTKFTQKGFTAIEAILIVIVLAILGGTGYYIYSANKKANSTYSSAAQASQSNAKFSAKKNPKSAKNTSSTQQYFTIKEWAVKAPYTIGPPLLYTFTKDAGPNVAYISTQDLANADTKCAQSGGGDVERVAATEHYSDTDAPADNSSPTAQQYASTLNNADYGHVGNYYYFYRHPQGLCGSGNPSNPADSSQENKIGDLMNQAIDQIKTLLPKFQAE